MKKYFQILGAVVWGMIFCGSAQAFSVPSQVQGVTVTQDSDTSVKLTWREASSVEDIIIGYRVYFGTTSVQEEEDMYDDELVVYGKTQVIITDLITGVPYYFAVTALDSEENESENYSEEQTFTLPAIQSPEPIECENFPLNLGSCIPYECEFLHPFDGQMHTRTITGFVDGKCEFVETLPDNGSLECRLSSDQRMDVAGEYEEMLQNTQEFEEGSFSINFDSEDIQETPLNKALADGSCVVSGYENEPEPEVECMDLPERLRYCEAYECEFIHILTEETLTRTVVGTVDGTCRYFEAMPNDQYMECRLSPERQAVLGQYYSDVMTGQSTPNVVQQFLNEDVCAILGEGALEYFPGDEPEPEDDLEVFGPEQPEEFKPVAPDTLPPLEAMNLMADMTLVASESLVLLGWDKSADLDGDVVDQVIYLREGVGNWDDGYSVGKDTEIIEVEVTVGKNYEYKVVTLDSAGNISESSVYSFSTKLAQSGPAGMLGVFIGILVIGAFALYASRRTA